MRFLVCLYVAACVAVPLPAIAQQTVNTQIRTANYFLRAGDDLTPALYDKLARYDVLILPMEAAAYNADFFIHARKVNPAIILLAYVPSRSISIKHIDDGAGIRKRLKSLIHDDWYIRSPNGSIIPAWPGTMPLSVIGEWNEALPLFVRDTIMASGMWDGVFYDEVDGRISFMNDGLIDLNRDGLNDDAALIDHAWQSGMTHLLRRTRELIGDQAVIVINGSSHPSYQSAVNGRMYESFPTPWEGSGAWRDSMTSYAHLSNDGRSSPLFIINADTNNTGHSTDYRHMRYALASSLLGNGYFGFDYGTRDHGQLWWYDEYDIALGKSSSEPYRSDGTTSDAIIEGVWRRDYQYGTVLVNSSDTMSEVSLDGEFEHLNGKQDRIANSGSLVSNIILPPRDGILLLRPLNRIMDTPYQNGAFARIFNDRGEQKRNGFFAYSTAHRGSTILYESRDGTLSVSARYGRVNSVVNGVKHEFVPFGKSYTDAINIAVENTTHEPLIISAPEYTESNTIHNTSQERVASRIVVAKADGTIIASWHPFDSRYSGSVRIAVGDLNNDGFPEIVASGGPHFEPLVRIFSLRGKLLSGGFYAYDKNFRGGVSVAVGNLDGSGMRRIITAPGMGGTSHIRIFTHRAKPLSPGFLAFLPSNRSGIRVLAADIDGDGKDEIIPTSMRVFTYALK